MAEESREWNKNTIYILFTDFEKPFDSIDQKCIGK